MEESARSFSWICADFSHHRPERPAWSLLRRSPLKIAWMSWLCVAAAVLPHAPAAAMRTNQGAEALLPKTPNVLTAPRAAAVPRMLYAPSEADDPAYRAAIAAITGGVVDYFDATADTPTPELLATYDCVYTWASFPYADKVLFGDRLADYVDAGGRVILGVFCTYTLNNSLSGGIMAVGYSPVVSPAGDNHLFNASYAQDGSSCLHSGVAAYSGDWRDILVAQGAGIVDGHYQDGEVALAYRPDGRVIYVNGVGSGGGGAGDWPQIIANACTCMPGPPPYGGVLYGCSNLGELFTVDVLTGSGFWVGNLPTYVSLGATEIEADGTTARAWVQTRASSFVVQAFRLNDGSALGPQIFDGAAYNGLEMIAGNLYGTAITDQCGGAELRILDPTDGSYAPIGPTGISAIAGLAHDPTLNVLYGLSGCVPLNGTSYLLTVDTATGAASVLGPTGFDGGSLEFGPDGNLYGGGSSTDGGRLYRINPTTGASLLVGPSGFGSLTGLTLSGPAALAVGSGGAGGFGLLEPMPNPSRRGAVQLRFSLPAPGPVRLELFDLSGRQVWEAAADSPAGDQAFAWDGRISSGRQASGGVYWVKLTTRSETRFTKLIRLP